MFTAKAQKHLNDAKQYFDEHLAQNDYYAAEEIRPGQWISISLNFRSSSSAGLRIKLSHRLRVSLVLLFVVSSTTSGHVRLATFGSPAAK